MKRLFFLIILTLACIQAHAQPGTLVKAGDSVPEFSVTMLDDSVVNIADLKGKVVLINFWATWCPYCREELKRVQKDIIDRFASDDFVYIPISHGENKETVMKFRQANEYGFSMGLDTDGAVFGMFAKSGIPRNFLIGRDGKIVAAEIGYNEEIFKKLTDKIAETLKTE